MKTMKTHLIITAVCLAAAGSAFAQGAGGGPGGENDGGGAGGGSAGQGGTGTGTPNASGGRGRGLQQRGQKHHETEIVALGPKDVTRQWSPGRSSFGSSIKENDAV